MLIEFTVGNYRSFKDKKTLRMDASTAVSEHRGNLILTGKGELLRSAVLYGANASGKSNLLRAMGVMRNEVLSSALRSSIWEIPIHPFLLNTPSDQGPSFFEAVFLFADIRYRYGFEVKKSRFSSEWLFESKREKEKPLFIREQDDIQISGNLAEAKGLEKRTKSKSLFLSVCDQFNVKVASEILSWFQGLDILISDDFHKYREATIEHLKSVDGKEWLTKFVKIADLGIEDVLIKTENFESDDVIEASNNLPVSINTVHNKYDANGEISGKVELNMLEFESSGTNKFFNISGSVYNCLHNGGLLIADELDVKLHPLMTRAIVRLFNDPATNPNNAQLIFATHDTNLLSYGNFRRDQIYFTEKDQYGATDLYSLAEFKEEGIGKVRKDRSFYKDYMQGRYGAVPHIDNLETLLNPIWQKSEVETNQ